MRPTWSERAWSQAAYLAGWRQGVYWVERNMVAPRCVLSTARFLLVAQAGPTDYSRGWVDAILSGYGA